MTKIAKIIQRKIWGFKSPAMKLLLAILVQNKVLLLKNSEKWRFQSESKAKRLLNNCWYITSIIVVYSSLQKGLILSISLCFEVWNFPVGETKFSAIIHIFSHKATECFSPFYFCANYRMYNLIFKHLGEIWFSDSFQ